MTIGQITNLLAGITVLQMMVTIGLGVTVGDVVAVARNWRMVGLAAVANYLAVPAITVGLLLLLRPDPMVAAGFLMAAVCPGAPYGPPFTAMVKGNVILAVGLMVILAGSSALLAPLLLQLLLPLVAGEGGAGGRPLTVDGGKILSTLVLIQLLPMCVGLYLRQRHPALADRLLRPFTVISKLLNLALVVTVLAVQFPMLSQIRLAGYGGMLALVVASVAVGWLAGGTGPEGRKTMAITTSVRNVGVSLVIATASFSGTPAVAATTAYGLFQTIVIALVALSWGRLSSAQIVATEQTT